jgi:hypothetical protein
MTMGEAYCGAVVAAGIPASSARRGEQQGSFFDPANSRAQLV